VFTHICTKREGKEEEERLEGDVRNVKAFTGNYAHEGIIEFEDTGVVILKFTNGAIGTINYTVNCFQKNMEGSLTIFGEKGTVKIGGQYLNELEYQNIEALHLPIQFVFLYE
jgi:predicted dehydrogenase